MRRTLLVLAVAAAAATTVASGAGGNGSPYSPGLTYGGDGVRARSEAVRFVTVGTAKSTIVAVIRVRGGRVLRSRALRGFYGVPLVAYDGTAGGLSGEGKSLVVASYGPLPGEAGTTRFAVLNTRTLGVRRIIRLPGSWSYDALSPDGATLYLVEHISVGPNPRYRVRALDVPAGRLLPRPIVDTKENEALMRGQPATRAMSSSGRWAYTLYARAKDAPFVHALDTERRQAYCIDLPLRLGEPKQMALRLRLDGDGALQVRNGRATVAAIDTRALKVVEGGS